MTPVTHEADSRGSRGRGGSAGRLRRGVVGAHEFEPWTPCAQGNCKKSISLVRLALFCVMVPGFGPNLSAFGPNGPKFFFVTRHTSGRRGQTIVSFCWASLLTGISSLIGVGYLPRRGKIASWTVADLSGLDAGLNCEAAAVPEIIHFVSWRWDCWCNRARGDRVRVGTSIRRSRHVYHASEIAGSSRGTNHSVALDVPVGPGWGRRGGASFDSGLRSSILDCLFRCDLSCVG